MQDNPAPKSPRTFAERDCPDCGRLFTPRSGRQVRCSECREGPPAAVCGHEDCDTQLRRDNKIGYCEPHKRPTARAPERQCEADDCERKLRIDNASGCCPEHAYLSEGSRASRDRLNARLRAETASGPDVRPECSVDECENRLRSDNTTGRCRDHHYLPLDLPECSVDDCTKRLVTASTLGRCMEHRALRFAATARVCGDDSCDQVLHSDNATGYCHKHRREWRENYNRDYYASHQDELVAYSAQYRADHPEEHRAASKAWALANPDQKFRNTRKSALWVKYRLTPEQVDAMLAEQGGVCALCGKPPPPGASGAAAVLHVDHDHVTGAVRALLCHRCNNGLGCFGDDPELMRRAADYIEFYRSAEPEAPTSALGSQGRLTLT